jgi:dCTP diphosphatase
MDDQTTLLELRQLVSSFVAARQWNGYHTAKNLAASIAIEAAELLEHFQWQTVEEGEQYLTNPEARAAVADELADVLIYCLSFANRAGIDLSTATRMKMARNERRFPVG